MIKFTRTQAQMICRNPAAYEVAKVQEAACHLLGYLDASPEEIQDACAAVEAGSARRGRANSSPNARSRNPCA